jgi:hypothetical protein
MFWFSFRAPGEDNSIGRGPFATREEAEEVRSKHIELGHQVTEISGSE